MSDSSRLTDLRILVRRLGPLLRGQARLFGIGIPFVMLSIGTAVAYPKVIQIIIDEGIQGGDLSIVGRLAMVMAGIVLVEAAATALSVYCFDYGARRVMEQLRQKLHANLMEQEIAFFDRESAGELLARLMGDITQIHLLLAVRLPDAVRFSFLLAASIGMVIYTSPILAAVVALVWPPIAFGTSRLGALSQRASEALQDDESQVSSAALESFQGIRTVRAFGQEGAERDRFRRFLGTHLASARRSVKVQAYLEGFSKLASEAALVIGIFVGGRLIVDGYLSAGALVAFILYASLLVRSTRNLSNFTADAFRAVGTTERLFRYLERETRMPIAGGLRPESARGRLDFENARFRYDGDARGSEVSDFVANLRIERGEEIAIVGPSGSGKSTLMNLAARLYDVDDGRVCFDGIDVRELDPQWLRQRVVYVSQDSSLFSRSILDNLRYGREDAELPEVREAVEAANADAFVSQQPDGLDTEVGDAGGRLSGGQRQRVALARALLREPLVLILDEATSALDSESESQIKESLRKLPYKPTVVWIAHRLSTVVDVARVLVVEGGRIVADGSHAELLEGSPFYRELVETQLRRE